MPVFAYLYAALLGACIGSFLNVVIHRTLRRESVVRPRSRCTHCHSQLAWYHNVPVLSYLGLRGRCAFCGAAISPSYVFVEVGTALVFAGLLHVVGWTLLLAQYATLAALLIAAAEIDRRHGIIPNDLVVTGAGLGLALLLATDASALETRLLAVLATGGLLLLVRVGSTFVLGQPGMGMGDVKLAAMLGLYLGWESLWVFYLAVILGGTLGLVGLLTRRLKRGTPLPFAPFIAVATALHLFLIPPDFFLRL